MPHKLPTVINIKIPKMDSEVLLIPKTIAGKTKRVTMPFQAELVREIDRIVKCHPEFGWNRLSFAQEAVREKILLLRELEAKTIVSK